MEQSILTGTKKILGVAADYTAFDHDILTHINATFSTLTQLGIGPTQGFFVEGENSSWPDLDIPENWLQLVRSYVYLKVRMLFDPPSTSFHIQAMNEQIREMEWRLSTYREAELYASQQLLEVPIGEEV